MMSSSPRSVMTRRCSAKFTWTMTSSPRSIMTKRCFAESRWTMTSFPRFVMTSRCSAQSMWMMTSFPRSVMTRRCSAQSTYRWWRRLRDMSWPDDVLCVVHVVYDFFSNVIHDQTMFRVVHVDYDVVPQVYHDQTMLFVVYVNYYATSSPGSIMTERCFAWFAWTMFLSPRSMTRRCSLRRGWCGLKWIYIKFSSYTFDKKMKKKTNN